MTKIILKTKRLNISIPNENSLDNRYKLLSDPLVSKYLGNGEPRTKEEVQNFLHKNIEHYQKYGFCLFDVFEKNTGNFIGDAGLIYESLNSENKNIEVGYRLHKEFWNKGYATELSDAFIKWGFDKFHFSQIVAYCKPDNISSSNVMEKCGLKYGGKHLYNKQTQCDIYHINNIINLRPCHEVKDAQVTLSEYDSKWIEKFEEEKKFLLNIIGNYCYGGIEHVGSTSVPGLTAKPVIDIMFGVKSLEESKSAIKILSQNGYNYYPYKEHEMHWLCKPSPEFRTHHLHLIPFESDLWKERIEFRDIIRSNDTIADEYAELKQKLSIEYKNDREAYTEAKSSFVKSVLKNFN